MMGDELRSAVLVSAVGIGLVFGVILLLWGLMALVVRAAADRPSEEQKVAVEPEDESAEADARERRAAAVVAAVTAAVEQQRVGDTAAARAAAAAVGAYLAGESGAQDGKKRV